MCPGVSRSGHGSVRGVARSPAGVVRKVKVWSRVCWGVVRKGEGVVEALTGHG
jgi:hypothetical protein